MVTPNTTLILQQAKVKFSSHFDFRFMFGFLHTIVNRFSDLVYNYIQRLADTGS